jgi:hypothetical protein
VIACRLRRLLTLAAPSSPAHLAAASGLVRAGERLYVVADDELSLGVFPAEGDAPGRLWPLFDGELPEEPKARKRAKPDLESLARLPADTAWPHGSLLALPSASRPNRTRGALVALDAVGAPAGPARAIDLADFFAPLREAIDALNVEGAVIVGDALLLFQRGNKATARNACVRFDYATFRAGLAAGAVRAQQPLRVDDYALGAIDAIPLAFSDACALPDGRVVFCAVAEDTDDPYLDGPFRGAAAGVLDAGGALVRLERLDAPAKVEGIDARMLEDGAVALLLVTDADDAAWPATLLEARM